MLYIVGKMFLKTSVCLFSLFEITCGEFVQNYFEKKSGQSIAETIKSVTTRTEMDCLVQCMDGSCTLAEYNSGSRLCRLGEGGDANLNETTDSDVVVFKVSNVIDECTGFPCQNGGTCVDLLNGYSCNCPEGTSGLNCEQDIDECASVPCQNGGTCVDMLNGYSCNCPEGTTGLNCEQDIDECASSPCQNGGTCVDLLNGYSCNCSEGTAELNCLQGFSDCKDIADNVTSAKSGIYEMLLWQSAKTLDVYCDMATDGGGWTVFQNRFNGSVEFHRNLSDYINGFGDINGEFWLGLDNLQEMVAQGPSELRIDVSSLGGSEGYETFQNFSISPGPGYTLNIALGNGTLGDSPLEGLSYNNNMNFSTFDRDMDMSSANCASYHEAGWWYTDCMFVHLNGQYCTPGTTSCGYSGMVYYSFMDLESLLTSRMMFRRV